jgi:hypothetical protein
MLAVASFARVVGSSVARCRRRLRTSSSAERPARTLSEAAVQAFAFLRRADREELPEGGYVYVDVIETLITSAVPLPDDWFAGEHDSRWRWLAGQYDQIRAPGQ